MTKTTLNPDGLPCRAGIIRWSTLPNGRMVFCGETGPDHDGNVIGAATQTPNAFILGRLNALSKPARSDQRCRCAKRLHHRRAQLSRHQRTRARSLGSNFPTSTMVQVLALARPELLLEINAIAVIS